MPTFAIQPDYGFGARWDEPTQSYSGPPKGLGYFGNLLRPDGGFSGELSVNEEVNGQPMEIPAMVPTLTKAELQTLLTTPENKRFPASVYQKAVAHAQQRIANGLSVWAQPGEQSSAYPDLPRVMVPPVQGLQTPGGYLPAYGRTGVLNTAGTMLLPTWPMLQGR